MSQNKISNLEFSVINHQFKYLFIVASEISAISDIFIANQGTNNIYSAGVFIVYFYYILTNILIIVY